MHTAINKSADIISNFSEFNLIGDTVELSIPRHFTLPVVLSGVRRKETIGTVSFVVWSVAATSISRSRAIGGRNDARTSIPKS